MRSLSALAMATLLMASVSAAAADGSQGPTPDEAATASGKPVRPAATSGTSDQTKDAGAADAGGNGDQYAASTDGSEAVRKAQEGGSYRLKDGGMYQPPQTRPAPLWNKGYGRT